MLRPDYSCPLPSTYVIEPTNVCTLKCPFCLTGSGRNLRPKGYLGLDDYRVILEKITPYAKMLYLTLLGEPLLNRNLCSMIAMATERNITTWTSTHFSLKDVDHESIVRSGLTWLVVSVDGATQETYSKYRVGGDLNLVLHNIRELQAAKERLGKSTPHVYWQFLINSYNEHEQEKAKQMAAALGVQTYFDLMGVNDPAWETSRHQNGELPRCIKGANAEEYKNADRCLPIPADKILLYPSIYSYCKQMFHTMIIDCHGKVYPCCEASNEHLVMGNLLTEDLSKIWNNAAFLTSRKYIYNYGPRQNTGSICEMAKCSLRQKYLKENCELRSSQ